MLRHDSDSAPQADRNASYLQDVLRLSVDETEDEFEERLRNEAQALGIGIDNPVATLEVIDHATQQKKPSFASDVSRRSSESVVSGASQSTGFMSTFSEQSRDYHRPSISSRTTFRSSLSSRDNEATVSRRGVNGAMNGRQSACASPPITPSRSAFSLPLSLPETSPNRRFRRLRGLSMLRLHSRNGSRASLPEGCPHCPPDPQSQRRAVHKLPCGHRLCSQALREIVEPATGRKSGSVPKCCGLPIPNTLVEQTTTQAHRRTTLARLEHQDDAMSFAISAKVSPRASLAVQHHESSTNAGRTASEESAIDPLTPRAPPTPDVTFTHPQIVALQQEQAAQHDRFHSWVDEQRNTLQSHHDRLRSDLQAIHAADLSYLSETHAAAIAEAEDKQVQAEATLREQHAQEKLSNATALKHMEAYCAGTYFSDGSPHGRPVTEQDRVELERTRRAREAMDGKHECAINVLRGEQSRRIRARILKQDREEQELMRSQRREEMELDRTREAEYGRLEEEVEIKKARLQRWRDIRVAICVRRLADAGNVDGGIRGRPTVVEKEDCASESAQLGKNDMSAAHGAVLEKVKSGGICTGIALCGQA
ncbi:hypothetical protein BAUCODRAFT_410536 [Baudoinia panamericana UAMH 10762]|uniref:Uncharacterized protein n=1 Tax=Baudoinia panamericana (strain UAMH 10762) TaxID=717646 RepID=M2LU09_BAUPA|nr:uncharacterized protein BAUCODRAFT_410536 [Baudoinia panamericana UAMH 10762]EMC98007.1 hypothetical protein BAUCODRAFT_410536 [Baudoinia panamericana UAMH 10762]